MESFISNIPPYAILSHRWAEKELTYEDVTHKRFYRRRRRWGHKIEGFRAQAKKDGLAYMWIDTCCIDKANSAELSESINCMYQWYQSAYRCYAYISDVRQLGDGHGQVTDDVETQLRRSVWFSRGWTLQELIAPSRVSFFDADWRFIGTRTDLSSVIQSATGITKSFLLGRAQPSQASAAQRMSWAAKRVTTREEDMAYCLLGLFGVSMPMLYGEGAEKAFLRLQEHITLLTSDDTILAWGLGPDPASIPGGILATSPTQFAGSEHVVVTSKLKPRRFEKVVNTLQMTVSVLERGGTAMYALLDCALENDEDCLLAIPLERTDSSDTFVRPRGAGVAIIDPRNESVDSPRTIRVRIDRPSPSAPSLDLSSCIDVAEIPFGLQLVDVHPRECWAKTRAMVVPARGLDIVILRVRPPRRSKADFVVVLKAHSALKGHSEREAHIMTLSKDHADSGPNSLQNLAAKLEVLGPKLYGKTTARIGNCGLRATVQKGEMKALGDLGFLLELELQDGEQLKSIKTADASAELAKPSSVRRASRWRALKK
ncbi:hypothetical protein RB597_000116 [Gaeumannomyces tritici]